MCIMSKKLNSFAVHPLVQQKLALRIDTRRTRDAAALFGTTCLSGSAWGLALVALVTAGSLFLALPAYAATKNVGTAQQLADAISSAQDGDVINLTANIALSVDLPHVTRNLTINGGGFSVSGVNKSLYVDAGTVAVNNLGGNWSLVKSGAGTTDLAGTNAYTGSTTVTGGLLRFHDAAALGAAGNVITLNGGSVGNTAGTPAATTVNRNIVLQGNGGINVALHPLTWAGNISGAGQFIKSGTGELELTGTNTYSGGTVIEQGGLRVTSDALLGAAGTGITIKDNASLRASASFTSNRPVSVVTAPQGTALIQVDDGMTLTLAGTVSGSSFRKTAAGTLVLTGNNSFIGMTVNAGTVVGNATSLPNFIRFTPSDARLPSVTFDQQTDGTFAGKITGNGSLTKLGAGTLTLADRNGKHTGGTTIVAGTLRWVDLARDIRGNIANNGALIWDYQSEYWNGTYHDVISGTGSVTKEGVGKLIIGGVQTYTGATNINAGNLAVNGSLKSSSIVNVNKGGTLSGNGIFGNVNVNGGKVSPGNSVGTIVIDGNLNMGPGSEYHVELNGNRSDLIQVTGSANILSSTFSIDHDTDTTSAPVLPGKTYTILTTGAGLTGSTPAVAVADFPFLNFLLSNDGFNAYLTTSRGAGAFAELATTRNEKAVANALDTAGPGSPLWQQVVGASEAQARAAFTSLGNASIHANVTGVLSAQSQHLRDAVTDRLRQDFGYGTSLAPASTALNYAPDARNAMAADLGAPFTKAPPVATPVPAQVYAVWAQALGSWGSLKGDGNAARTEHSLGGVLSGLDVTFNGQWRVGLAGGYSQSVFRSPDVAASGSSNNYHIALYGGGQVGAWGLRGGASYSMSDVTTSRQAGAVQLRGPQNGDYSANTTQVFGELGYNTRFGAVALEPFANVAYVLVDGGINETGVAAVIGSSKLDTTYTTLGLRGATALTSMLTARGTLGWRHALGDITPVAALAFQSGGSAFALAGSPIARNALVAEAGVDVAVAANATLGVSWTGQYAEQSQSNTFKGNFNWSF